jgi:hypothetical protein
VVRVLRHEFAAKRLGQHGLIVAVDELAGVRRLLGEAIDPGEQASATTG